MGLVRGATSLNPFPDIPVYMPYHGGYNDSTYRNIHQSDIDFTDITTLWLTFYWDDDALANPYVKLTIAGVTKSEADYNVTGTAIIPIDCSAITGICELILAYKCANTGAYISRIGIYAGGT